MEQMLLQDAHKKKIDEVIARYEGKPGALLGMLEDIQKLSRHKYLPQEVLRYTAQKTGVPLARIFGVVSFYAFFNLQPQGDHTIIVCRGTACHTRRSKNLLEYVKTMLGLKEEGHHQGEKLFLTTADNKFTLRTVACFGQCALAPVVDVDGTIYGHMTESKLRQIVLRTARGKKQ